MTSPDTPDPRRLRESILSELRERGLPESYQLHVEYLPDRDIIALDLEGGEDSFEIHDLYDWRDGSRAIAEDILDHYRGT